MPDYAFTVFTGIGCLLCVPGLLFNIKTDRPWATLIIISEVLIVNFLSFIESIIWGSNDPNQWWDGRYFYCFISSRVKDGMSVAIPAIGICIFEYMAAAVHPDPPQNSMKSSMSWRNGVALGCGVLLPLFIVVLKCLVETSQYWIKGVCGCTGRAEIGLLSVFIYYVWPPGLTLVASGYASIPPLLHY